MERISLDGSDVPDRPDPLAPNDHQVVRSDGNRPDISGWTGYDRIFRGGSDVLDRLDLRP